MNKYSINVQWSEEDECFVALVPEFPTLSAFGETREEALAEAKVALQGFIDIYQADGLPLPEPKCVPSHSGQLRIRIPKTLHGELAKEAERQGVSLNSHIIYLLSEKNISSHIEQQLKSIDSQFGRLLLSGIPEQKAESKQGQIYKRWMQPGEVETCCGTC